MNICKLCGKEVTDQYVYDNFCGMHVKCENEINDCKERGDYNVN